MKRILYTITSLLFSTREEIPYRMGESFSNKLPLRISHTIIPPDYFDKDKDKEDKNDK